jgi:hypothetical protein
MLCAVLADAPTTQPTTAPAGVVLVHDEADLLAAIRARLDELETTYAGLDAAAGLPDRFASKLLCDPPMRRISSMTLWLILPALGYDIGLIHNADALNRVKGLLSKRKLPHHRPPSMITIARRRVSPWLFNSERARKNGRLGGLARAAKRRANAAISKVRRQGALARWSKRLGKVEV